MSKRWAIWFGVQGDLRFLSHHDMMRLMERAAARAELPLKHSQGFNPRPKLSLVLPRPVGVASRCELLTAEFDREVPDDAWAQRLAGQLPAGITLTGVQPLEPGKPPRLRQAAYELALEGDEPARAAARLAELEKEPGEAGGSSALPDQADGKCGLRDRVGQIKLENGKLSFVLAGDDAGPGRPRDVLALLGLLPDRANAAETTEMDTPVLARLTRTGIECGI